eukprot:SAG31_NODE_540_length_14288_cov_51.958066_4_plen_70_part_00
MYGTAADSLARMPQAHESGHGPSCHSAGRWCGGGTAVKLLYPWPACQWRGAEGARCTKFSMAVLHGKFG